MFFILFLLDFTGVMTSSAENGVTGRTLTLLDVSMSDKWHTFCVDCEVIDSANLDFFSSFFFSVLILGVCMLLTFTFDVVSHIFFLLYDKTC